MESQGMQQRNPEADNKGKWNATLDNSETR